MSGISEEINYQMLFYDKIRKTVAKTCWTNLKVYSKNAVTTRRNREWLARFHSKKFDAKFALRFDQSVTKKVEENLQLVEKDLYASFQEIAEALAINYILEPLKTKSLLKVDRCLVIILVNAKKFDWLNYHHCLSRLLQLMKNGLNKGTLKVKNMVKCL